MSFHRRSVILMVQNAEEVPNIGELQLRVCHETRVLSRPLESVRKSLTFQLRSYSATVAVLQNVGLAIEAEETSILNHRSRANSFCKLFICLERICRQGNAL